MLIGSKELNNDRVGYGRTVFTMPINVKSNEGYVGINVLGYSGGCHQRASIWNLRFESD